MITSDFVIAGHAIFTVQSVTGERYTYKVKRMDARGDFKESWFIYLLTGPENTSNYTYLGMLSPSDLSARLTRASKYNEGSKPVKVLVWALAMIRRQEELPEGYKICHAGRCCRCGRLLTVPRSIETGIGPECERIMIGE